MSSNPRQVTVGNEPIEYYVRRSGDATEPRIDVDIEGVTIILPEGSDEDPESMLTDNVDWVLEKTAKYRQYRREAPDRRFQPGEQFPYLGEEHTLIVEPRQKAVVQDGSIRLRQSAADQSSVKRALENFYRRQARKHLTGRVDEYAIEMDVDYDEIEIRNQRTRWGSCSTSGTLGFNWRLMMAPLDVINYVVVHELAHLREQNHTPRFWGIVAEHDPEYSEHAEWLEKNSARLIFCRDDL